MCHRIYIYIYIHSNREDWRNDKKYWTQTDQNPAWQSPNPIALCVMSKDLSGSVLPALLIVTHFISGWFHAPALPGRYPSALAL